MTPKARGLGPGALPRLLLPKRLFARRYEELEALPPQAEDAAALELPGVVGPIDAPAPAANPAGPEEDFSPRDPTAKPAASRNEARAPSFLKSERQLAHVGPGFLAPNGMTNGRGLANGPGLVNGNGSGQPKGRGNGGRVNGGHVNGGRINGGKVTGGRVNGGHVNGGRVNGGRVNGGRVNGGRVNGGRTNGGATNGSGFVNGRGLLYTDSVNHRRRRSTRRMAILLALLFVSMAVLGPFLYLGVFAPQPIVVDGDFSDWAGFAAYPDSAADQVANGNVNLVAFAAVESDREFYFYFQVPQGMHPFAGPQNPPGAESFRILFDSDRNASTGYFAFGLGIDFVVELSGYDGGLKSASLRVFSGPASQRTDAAFFQTSGAVRAIVSGNQIEGSVARGDIRLAGGRTAPLLLALAQDSRGARDLGDEIYTTLPGALVLSQTPTSSGTIPTDRDVLLLTLSGRALHENATLTSLGLFVDGVSGAGIEVAYALTGGRNETQNSSAQAGGTATVTFQSQGPLGFNVFGAPQTIEIWGRATGPVSVGALRVFMAGAANISTGSAPAGFSGHGSVFPPFVFERSYVGAAASPIRIDGAFADWSAVRPFDGDPDDDVRALSVVPTPNATNAPETIDQNVDLRFTKADVNSGDGQVSFYLEVEGSIMAGRLLPLPAYPRPSAASQGGGGGGAPGETVPDADVATLYVDVDANALTGWAAAPAIGVDTVIQIFGAGGAYGRIPHTTRTTLAQWNATTMRFSPAEFAFPVGYGSSKLEAQIPAARLCSGPCPPVRYLYMLQSVLGDSDSSSVLTTNYRGQGQALLLEETSGLLNNAYQGDLDVPILDISIASLPTNEFPAQILGLTALITGVFPVDLTAVAFSADLNGNGRLDPAEASAPSLTGQLLASGYADLLAATNITIGPGERFDGFLTVDISAFAHTPSFLNATVAGVAGLRSAGIPDVRYTSDPTPRALRILAYTPGGRAQNDLVINEVNLVQGFVEIFDTTGSSTSLTSPSRMGLQVYRTTNGANIISEAILVFSGSTNSEGFATFNLSVPLSTATRNYFVTIWCANCTAGQDDKGKFNNTYVDFIPMPRITSNGSWGRFPDGDLVPRNTTNNTRNDNNQIAGTQNGTPPSSQNYLVINEVSFVGGWVEIVSIIPTLTNLTSPSAMGIHVYSTNINGGAFLSNAIVNFAGTTNPQGFAVINVTVPYSSAQRRFFVGLWCANCTAGQDYRGRDNQSYVDVVELPLATPLGAWGRYPDGDGGFFNTTNNTRGTDNQIPEFSDIVVPLAMVMGAAWVGRRRRARQAGDGAPNTAAP